MTAGDPAEASRPSRPRPGRWLGPLLLAAATSAQAGLFDDDEARRAIVELRARVEQLQVQAQRDNQARQAELADAVSGLKRSLLDLNSQIESLRTDVAKLRGADELRARDLSDLQRRPAGGGAPDPAAVLAALDERLKPQEERWRQLDERLKRLEPQKVSVDGQQFLVAPDEKKAYDEAVGTLRGNDFAAAVDALTGFQRRFPASGYSDNVRYWLGNAYYGRRDYKEAISSFRALISANPQHPRAAEALLAVANCQIELKDTKAARRTLEELLKTYPQSEAAAAGRQRMAAIK